MKQIQPPWKLISLPKICDARGNLTFLENGSHIPFDIARVEWIYDIPSMTSLEGYALTDATQLFIALSGRFIVDLHDRHLNAAIFDMSAPDSALLVAPMTWVTLGCFATNSVVLRITSAPVSEERRITSFDTFRQLVE